jgi:hypothetical protein
MHLCYADTLSTLHAVAECALQAYLTLCSRDRQGDADALLQLLQRLEGTKGSGGGSSAGGSSGGAAGLSEAPAAASVLLALAFSAPPPAQPLVGLPGLESPQLDAALMQAAAAAAPLSSCTGDAGTTGQALPFAPAAGGAISLLQARPLVTTCGPPAAEAAGASGAGALSGGAGGAVPWGNPVLSSLLLGAGCPSRQLWGAALSAAGTGDRGGGAAVSQPAAAAVRERQVRANALRRLAGKEPDGGLPALPGQLTAADAPQRRGVGAAPDQDSGMGPEAACRAAKAARQSAEEQQLRGPHLPAAGPGMAEAAAAAEGEEECEMVRLACLALQGVCSAADELYCLAASEG